MRSEGHTRYWLTTILFALGCGGFEKGVEVRNTPPSVAIQQPAESSPAFRESDLIEFVARIGDDADAPSELSLTWSSDVQGVFENTSTVDDATGQVTWTTGALEVDSHVIVIEVVDSSGESTSDSVEVSVEADSDYPWIRFVHPLDSEVGEDGEEFYFQAEVGDAQDESELLQVAFYWETDTSSGGSSDGLEDVCPPPPVDSLGLAGCDAMLPAGTHVLTYYVIDTDGFETETTRAFVVETPLDRDEDEDGFTIAQGDCDDNDGSVNPGADEVYNGVDDDCDGEIDEGTEGFDNDGDGHSSLEGDCDDDDVTITREDCDGDGFDSEDYGGEDCDDDDSTVYPGAPDIWYDGVDSDCEGNSDYDADRDGYDSVAFGGYDCDDTDPDVTVEDCDGDGWVSVEYGGADCDDTDVDISPDAAEECDGVDNDCDGNVDEEGAAGCTVYYRDADLDGYGSTEAACMCGPTEDYTSLSTTDCYDDNSEANPEYDDWATTDRGDGSFDWDCSGVIDREHGTTVGSCSCDGTSLFGVCLSSCGFDYGWNGSAPTCGASGTFIINCDHGLLDDCDAETETRLQRCR